MPKLSDIVIDSNLYRGRGIRPWNDLNVVKPQSKEIKEIINNELSNSERSVSEALANGEQNVSKTLANGEQNNELKNDCVNKALAKPLAEPLANSEQSVSKALAISTKITNNETIETLVGNEKKLLLFLFQKCQLLGSLESPAITTDELKNILKINAVHLRNVIHRLSNKNVIEVYKIKNGRAGWRKFKFSKQTFQNLSLDQSVSNALANREQTVNNALAKPLAEPLARPFSSGSGNLYKTTTEDNLIKFQPLPIEWQNIEIEPLCEIGFTETHLTQIAKQNILSPKAVQDSIYAFAFDLKENDKKKEITGTPINFFMGILRKGLPYTPPDSYETPQERHMRLYEEKMSKLKAQREEIEKKSFNLAFEDWFRDLPDSKKVEFIPKKFRGNPRLEKNKMLEGGARDHFTREIWPDIKGKILVGET